MLVIVHTVVVNDAYKMVIIVACGSWNVGPQNHPSSWGKYLGDNSGLKWLSLGVLNLRNTQIYKTEVKSGRCVCVFCKVRVYQIPHELRETQFPNKPALLEYGGMMTSIPFHPARVLPSGRLLGLGAGCSSDWSNLLQCADIWIAINTC